MIIEYVTSQDLMTKMEAATYLIEQPIAVVRVEALIEAILKMECHSKYLPWLRGYEQCKDDILKLLEARP